MTRPGVPEPENLRPICVEAAAAGGAELLAWYGRVHARQKGPRDFVTEADLAAQKAVQRVISARFPDHAFLGEEGEEGDEGAVTSGAARIASSGWLWLVDPLDGTTNFLHGLPYFAVSVGVALDGRVVAGAVLDPVRNECFSAAAGHGAFLGEAPIRTSGRLTLDEALLAFSLPARVRPHDPELEDVARIATKCRGLRRLGAAALNLCYVAAGRLDGYWARKLHAWDFAAGSLIVQEAGGAIASFGAAAVDLDNPALLTAASEPLFRQLRDELLAAAPRV